MLKISLNYKVFLPPVMIFLAIPTFCAILFSSSAASAAAKNWTISSAREKRSLLAGFLGKFIMSLSDKVFFSPNAAPHSNNPFLSLRCCALLWICCPETRGPRRYFVSKRYLMYPHFVIRIASFFFFVIRNCQTGHNIPLGVTGRYLHRISLVSWFVCWNSGILLRCFREPLGNRICFSGWLFRLCWQSCPDWHARRQRFKRYGTYQPDRMRMFFWLRLLAWIPWRNL